MEFIMIIEAFVAIVAEQQGFVFVTES